MRDFLDIIGAMGDALTPRQRSLLMSRVRGKDTRPEMIVRRLVHSMGFRYRLHVRTLPGTPDLVFASRRKIVNVNGCFWHDHGCSRSTKPQRRREWWAAKFRVNRQRDRRTRAQLRRLGWDVLTVWECELGEAVRLAARLSAFLNRVQ